MDPLQLRETEIFETLKAIKYCDFVVIGGYAVNAYALPRFSIDCDVVVRHASELEKIEKIVAKQGYEKIGTDENLPYAGKFFRYEKKLDKYFKVSIDILFDKILDRQTDSIFTAEWVFENSSITTLKGKTVQEKLKLRTVNVDALIVMKTVCCRLTDIRDVFMIIPNAKNTKWILNQINLRTSFEERLAKMKEKITSKQFKDGLQGVYGRIDDTLFEKHKKLILNLEKG